MSAPQVGDIVRVTDERLADPGARFRVTRVTTSETVPGVVLETQDLEEQRFRAFYADTVEVIA